MHRDHLGSPELITSNTGGVLVRPSFGAYGERRDGTDWNGPPSAGDLSTIANTSRRGFTGHEHLDAVGLIHMNGRVYEPVAGRFLSVDPIVHLGASQSPNSYGHVWNNPLSYVDPSGFDPCDDPVVIECPPHDPDPPHPRDPRRTYDPELEGAARQAWLDENYQARLDFQARRGARGDAVAAVVAGNIDLISNSPGAAMQGAGEGRQTYYLGEYTEFKAKALVAAIADWMRSQGLIDFEPEYVHVWAAEIQDSDPLIAPTCEGTDPWCGLGNERKSRLVGGRTKGYGKVFLYRAAVEDIDFLVAVGIRGPPRDFRFFDLNTLNVRERIVFILGHENYHHANIGKPPEAGEGEGVEYWANEAGWRTLEIYRKWKSQQPGYSLR